VGLGLVFAWRTALIAYLVGTIVTVVAAYGPARRAAKVPPVAAMRDDIAMPESSMRRRTVGGLALIVLGAVALVLGFAQDTLAYVGAGLVGIFIGVALLAPLLGRPICRCSARPTHACSAPSGGSRGRTPSATLDGPRRRPRP